MFISSEKDEEKYWNEWKLHSHRWQEWEAGKYQCTWCSLIYIQETSNIDSIEICRFNPKTFAKNKVDTTFY